MGKRKQRSSTITVHHTQGSLPDSAAFRGLYSIWNALQIPALQTVLCSTLVEQCRLPWESGSNTDGWSTHTLNCALQKVGFCLESCYKRYQGRLGLEDMLQDIAEQGANHDPVIFWGLMRGNKGNNSHCFAMARRTILDPDEYRRFAISAFDCSSLFVDNAPTFAYFVGVRQPGKGARQRRRMAAAGKMISTPFNSNTSAASTNSVDRRHQSPSRQKQ